MYVIGPDYCSCPLRRVVYSDHYCSLLTLCFTSLDLPTCKHAKVQQFSCVPEINPTPMEGDEQYYPVSKIELPYYRFQYGASPEQYCDLRLPKDQSKRRCPIVAVLHGGFWQTRWTAALMNAACNYWSAHGAITWNIEYRRVEGGGVPSSGGGASNTLDDAARALELLVSVVDRVESGQFESTGDGCLQREELARFLVEQKLNDITVIGHSAGGQIALWLASRDRYKLCPRLSDANLCPFPKRVLSLAAVTDMVEGRYLGDDKMRVPTFLGAQYPSRNYELASPFHLGNYRSTEIVSVHYRCSTREHLAKLLGISTWSQR